MKKILAAAALATPFFTAVFIAPVPMAFVRIRLSPDLAPAFVITRFGSIVPVTA